MSHAAPRAPAGGIELVDTGRYELLGEVGRGGGGRVWRALDRELGHEVALKTIDDLGPRERFRLKREFRILQGLQHPGVVAYEDLVVDGARCFFTMELVVGRPWLQHVRGVEGPADPGPVPTEALPRLRAAVRQLITALRALHGAGLVHRDLKPANVLVDDDGRVVVIDFGLALSAGSARGVDGVVAPARIEGTPKYMAPEQVHGEEPTPAADLYSTGVMIYEALTGGPPWSGPPSLLLHRKTKHPAEPVRDRAPDADPVLASLADALLTREPDARLDAGAALAWLDGGPVSPTPPRFLGRGGELRWLAGRLKALGDEPMVVAVRGPSGIGKTALVRRFLDVLDEAGNAIVLRGRCHPQETVGHNALDGIIDDLSSVLAENGAPLDAVDGPQRATLARAFPVLARIEALRDLPAPDDDPRQARRRLADGLQAVIGALAAERPVVVSVDDAQWADRASVAPLLALLARPAPVLLLWTVRSDTEPGPLLAAVDELPVRYETQTVGPLGDLESRALLGLTRDAPADPLLAEAAGNPWALREIAAAHLEGLRPASLAELLRARVDRVDAAAGDLLDQLALVGAPLPRPVARALAEGAGAPALLAQLHRARLVRGSTLRGRPAVQLAHDRIRRLRTDAIDPEARPARHGALARALAAIAGVDPAILASQFTAAGDPAAAAPHARAAAEEAMARMAFDRAVDLRRLALEGAAPDGRGPDTRALADALDAAGRAAESAERLLQAIDLGASPSPARDRRAAAERLIGAGHLERGRAVLDAVLREARMPVPGGRVSAVGAALFWRLRLLLRGLVPRGAGADPERVDAAWTVAGCLGYFDPIRALGVQSRHLLLALDAGDPRRLARALALELVYIGGTGKTSAREVRIRQRLLEARGQLDDPADGAFLQVAAGYKSLHDGHFRQALADLDEAERLYRRRGRSDWGRSMGLTHGLVVRTFTGDFADLGHDYEELAGRYRDADDRLALANLDLAVGYLCDLLEDESEAAARRIAEAPAGWGAPPPLSFLYMSTLATVQWGLYAGDAAAACDAIDGAWKSLSMLERFVSERVLLHWMRGASHLAAGAAAEPAGRALIAKSRDVIARSGADWAAGLERVLTAGLQHAVGDDPAPTLDEAAAAFAAADMEAWAAAARLRAAELRGDRRARLDGRRALRALGIARPDRWTAMYSPVGLPAEA